MRIRSVLLPLALLITLCMPLFVLSGQVAAVDIFSNCGANSPNEPEVCQDADQQQGDNGTDNPIISIIKAAINVLSFIIGVAAVITIVVSGIRMITAGGDTNSIASARTGLIYALVGIAIVALAQTLVVFVLDNVS